ncbi:hypothetical protein [Pseudorhodoferax sp.]|uniref:hypothetical protein n=1 Tax=Pseudorhodoferax sp. TaxID=1993553 RepID=UPI002DD66FEA|nr:hypothetical protein [Pseudorhodoferax sp.]
MTAEAITYRTTNGHTVLVDPWDWPALSALLDSGVRLQSRMQRGALVVVLVDYGPPRVTMYLSKFLLGAKANQVVAMQRGPLDHRRESMELVTEARRLGHASRVHAMDAAGRA